MFSFCSYVGLMLVFFFPLHCFRAHRWGDLEVWHPCHQRSWQVTQLYSGRQGLQHLISERQREVLRIHPERRNQPWQDQQCGAKWHAEEGELGRTQPLGSWHGFWLSDSMSASWREILWNSWSMGKCSRLPVFLGSFGAMMMRRKNQMETWACEPCQDQELMWPAMLCKGVWTSPLSLSPPLPSLLYYVSCYGLRMGLFLS